MVILLSLSYTHTTNQRYGCTCTQNPQGIHSVPPFLLHVTSALYQLFSSAFPTMCYYMYLLLYYIRESRV